MIVIGEYRVYFQMLIQPLIFFACNAFSTNFLINCFYLIYITCINNGFDRLARIAALAKARSVDPALISTDVGSNPSECMLELASGITQIKYAVSLNRDSDRNVKTGIISCNIPPLSP